MDPKKQAECRVCDGGLVTATTCSIQCENSNQMDSSEREECCVGDLGAAAHIQSVNTDEREELRVHDGALETTGHIERRNPFERGGTHRP